MLIAGVSLIEVLVPLIAAAIGAATGAGVSRHLRRQELYVQAAQKINGYVDEAADALNEMDPGTFDLEQIARAKRAVNLAVFHSRRLESVEVTSRLQVADFVLWDMVTFEDSGGRHWAYRAIDDAMAAVVEFMVLPRLWPPHRISRAFPPHRMPNSVELYKELVDPGPTGERLNWPALRQWVKKREGEIR